MKSYNRLKRFTVDLKDYVRFMDAGIEQSVSADLSRGFIKPEHFYEYAVFFKEYCSKPHSEDVDTQQMKGVWVNFTAELPLLVYTRPTDGEEGAVWNTLKADEKRNFITIDDTTKAEFSFRLATKVKIDDSWRRNSNGGFYRRDSGEKAYRAHSVIYAKTLIRWLTLYHSVVANFLCSVRQAMTDIGCNNKNVPDFVLRLFENMDADETFVCCNVDGLTETTFGGSVNIAKNITIVGSKDDMLSLDATLKKVGLSHNYQKRLILMENIESEVAEAQLIGLFAGETTGVPKYGSLMPIAWECAMGYTFLTSAHGAAMFNHMNYVPMGQTQAAQAKFKQISKKLVIFGAASPSISVLVTSAGFVMVDNLDNPQTFELMAPETLAATLGLKTLEQFSLERNTKGYPTDLIHEYNDRYYRIKAVYTAMRKYYLNDYISHKYRRFDANVGHEPIMIHVSEMPLQDVSPQVFAGLPFEFNTKACWRNDKGFSRKNFEFLNYVAYLMGIIHSLMSCTDLRFYKDEKLSSTEKYHSFDEYIKDALTEKRVRPAWTVRVPVSKGTNLDYIPQSAIANINDASKACIVYAPIGIGDTYDNWEMPVLK